MHHLVATHLKSMSALVHLCCFQICLQCYFAGVLGHHNCFFETSEGGVKGLIAEIVRDGALPVLGEGEMRGR